MLEVIITSTVLILALALLRRLWRGKLSPILQYALWLIVGLRLLLPIPMFTSQFGIMNLVNRMMPAQEQEGRPAPGMADIRVHRASGEADGRLVPGEGSGGFAAGHFNADGSAKLAAGVSAAGDSAQGAGADGESGGKDGMPSSEGGFRGEFP